MYKKHIKDKTRHNTRNNKQYVCELVDCVLANITISGHWFFLDHTRNLHTSYTVLSHLSDASHELLHNQIGVSVTLHSATENSKKMLKAV